jgi:NADH:ubiquinone oxidoreductase subunit F (NADH-binding)
MKVILETLIKRAVLFLELKNAGAPEIILQTEEKFLNEKIDLLKKQIKSVAEDLEGSEIEELDKCSPCYTCKNGTREEAKELKPLQCSKSHLMDDNNINERVDTGCSDYDEINMFPNFVESRVKSIQEKYSEENIKEVLKLICSKLSD